jgi:hypothetical protein
MGLHQKVTVSREEAPGIPVNKSVFRYPEIFTGSTSIARANTLAINARNNNANLAFRNAKPYRTIA